MVKNTFDAFIDNNVILAQKVIKQDVLVDNLDKKINAQLKVILSDDFGNEMHATIASDVGRLGAYCAWILQ